MMGLRHIILLLTASALLAFAGVQPVFAVEAADELAELDALLGEMMAEIDEEERKLLKQVARVKQVENERKLIANRSGRLGEYRGAGDVDTPIPEEVGAEQKAESQQAQDGGIPDLPRISDEVGGVTTPKGRLIMEPSVRYAHSSVGRVSIEGLAVIPALVIGAIDISEVDRDSYTASVATRYGITRRLEADVNVPYLWRSDSTRSREFFSQTTEEGTRSSSGSGLGDIEFGMRYQINRGHNGWPFLLGNLRVKSTTGTDPFELANRQTLSGDAALSDDLPTGSGFWSVNPSMTFIYPSDPVVFFGNIGYLWTLADDKGTYIDIDQNGDEVIRGFGKVDPGDALKLNFGMGLGLNDRTSLSLSYSLDQFSKTSIEMASTGKIAGSDVTIGRLVMGFSLRTKKGIPLNLAIGIGATEDAPDTDISFRMPVNFFN